MSHRRLMVTVRILKDFDLRLTVFRRLQVIRIELRSDLLQTEILTTILFAFCAQDLGRSLRKTGKHRPAHVACIALAIVGSHFRCF